MVVMLYPNISSDWRICGLGTFQRRSKLMVQEREMEKDTVEPVYTQEENPGFLWKAQLSGEASGKKSGMLWEQPLSFAVPKQGPSHELVVCSGWRVRFIW